MSSFIIIFEVVGLASAYWTYSVIMVMMMQGVEDWIAACIY